ncbi:transcription factor SRM1, partial [Olea europaea subsp. europaea]
MPTDESSSSMWSREQDRQFEKALATYPEDCSDRWEKIAADVPGKSLEEVKHHHDLLVDDVDRIESGCVPLSSYNSSSDGSTNHAGDEETGKKGGSFGHLNRDSNHGGKGSKSDQERRKGIAWTEEEHRAVIEWSSWTSLGDSSSEVRTNLTYSTEIASFHLASIKTNHFYAITSSNGRWHWSAVTGSSRAPFWSIGPSPSSLCGPTSHTRPFSIQLLKMIKGSVNLQATNKKK